MFACPNCGGNLKFNIAAQQLSCEHCETEFDPYAFDDKDKDALERQEFDVTIFTCPQCGGEILSTDTSAAEFCSFCGASTILFSRISKEKRPDYIIPFQKTKDDCKKAYSEIMKKAIFAPKELKDARYIDGFRGIYIPYWAFNISQEGIFSLRGSRTRRRGDFIYTDHYALHGEIEAYYNGLSYDASSSFDDDISAKIAPFDVKQMKKFTPAYLSGFYGDTSDVDSHIYAADAENTAFNNSIHNIYKKFPGIAITEPPTPESLHTKMNSVDNAMFPVWFMSYRNGDRVAYATVNGQTGKVVTDLPIDTKKYVLGSLLLAIPIFIVLNLFFTILPPMLLIFSLTLTIIAMFFLIYEQHQIKKRESGELDRGSVFKKQQAALYFGKKQKELQAEGIQNDFDNRQNQTESGRKTLGFTTALAALIVSLLILFLNPVSDIYYYAGVIFTAIALFITIKDIIYYYNIMATRRLPQFDRTGGDDNA